MLSKLRKKQKGLAYKKLLVPLAVVALFVATGVLIVANINMYRKKATLRAQVESLERKISDAKAKNDKLQQEIDQSSDDAYIEKVAREELDLQKPGEQVVSFVAVETADSAPTPAKKNMFQAWVGWIGELFK